MTLRIRSGKGCTWQRPVEWTSPPDDRIHFDAELDALALIDGRMSFSEPLQAGRILSAGRLWRPPFRSALHRLRAPAAGSEFRYALRPNGLGRKDRAFQIVGYFHPAAAAAAAGFSLSICPGMKHSCVPHQTAATSR
jgi:hypothetical protein